MNGQILNPSAKYLLDECLPVSVQEFISGEYIHFPRFLPYGTPDDVILEEASKRGLIIITKDIKFVLQTITKNQDIIYQNMQGERHYIRSHLFATNCFKRKSVEKKTQYLLENDLIIVP